MTRDRMILASGNAGQLAQMHFSNQPYILSYFRRTYGNFIRTFPQFLLPENFFRLNEKAMPVTSQYDRDHMPNGSGFHAVTRSIV